MIDPRIIPLVNAAGGDPEVFKIRGLRPCLRVFFINHIVYKLFSL
jgi:hypothetical protein